MSNLYKKIIQVYTEVQGIVKDGEIAQGGSSYTVVTHDAVTKALHMPIAKAGLVVMPDMVACDVSEFEKVKVWNGQETKATWYKADVTAKIKIIDSDDPKQFVESTCRAYAFDTSDKAIGKAYSMAIKNIYLKVFMLESMDKEESRDFDGADYKQAPPKMQPKPLPNFAPRK